MISTARPQPWRDGTGHEFTRFGWTEQFPNGLQLEAWFCSCGARRGVVRNALGEFLWHEDFDADKIFIDPRAQIF